MPRATDRKEHLLSMRLPEADIAIIDRAAALRGRLRTDFVRDAAVRAAEDALMETIPIRMSAAGFKAFMAALSEPAASVPEMVEIYRRAAPWETSSLPIQSPACSSDNLRPIKAGSAKESAPACSSMLQRCVTAAGLIGGRTRSMQRRPRSGSDAASLSQRTIPFSCSDRSPILPHPFAELALGVQIACTRSAKVSRQAQSFTPDFSVRESFPRAS